MKTSFLNSARADYMKALAVLGEVDPQDAENFSASVFGALVSFEDNPKASRSKRSQNRSSEGISLPAGDQRNGDRSRVKQLT